MLKLNQKIKRTAALVLAAGRSSRMKSEIPKQFMMVGDRPLFMYSVEKYMNTVDLVVVVTGKEDVETARHWLWKAGVLDRVPVIEGGSERFDSSMNGLKYLQNIGTVETVLIHDAARAMITEEVIERCLQTVRTDGAAVAAMPLKDTVKTADPEGYVTSTPDRRTLYTIQTPQGFSLDLILEAYRRFYEAKEGDPTLTVTDDASVVERFTDHPVRLFEGAYDNLKITTPEDLKFLNLPG